MWSEVLWTEISRIESEQHQKLAFSDAVVVRPEEGHIAQPWFVSLLRECSAFNEMNRTHSPKTMIRQTLLSRQYCELAPL